MKKLVAVGVAVLGVMFATASLAVEDVGQMPGFDVTPAFALDLATIDPNPVAAPEVAALGELEQVNAVVADCYCLSADRTVAASPLSVSTTMVKSGPGRVGHLVGNVDFHLLI